MTKTHSVLIVDDEKNIADTVALILQDAGYVAKPAYNSSVALSMTPEHAPDLIISDVVMPGMNGIELAITTRRQYPHCIVLLLSGQAASADMLEDARARGYDFELLAKPLEPEDLLKKVADVFASAREGIPSRRT